MIKANHVQSSFTRVFLALDQLFRANQESIALGFLFARVGDRVSLGDDLMTTVLEPAQH